MNNDLINKEDSSIIVENIHGINNNANIKLDKNIKTETIETQKNIHDFSNINIVSDQDFSLRDKINKFSKSKTDTNIKNNQYQLDSMLIHNSNNFINDKLAKNSVIFPSSHQIENNQKSSAKNNKHKISHFYYITKIFCCKKKSQNNLTFESLKDFLIEKSSIDIILRSLLGVELMKKLLFEREDYLDLQNLDYYDEKYLLMNSLEEQKK